MCVDKGFIVFGYYAQQILQEILVIICLTIQDGDVQNWVFSCKYTKYLH